MFGHKAAAAKIIEELNESDEQRVKLETFMKSVRDTQFTPDLWQLERKQSHLIFIHDDMMQLQPHHDMVKEGSLSGFYPLNYGYTSRKFNFLKKNLGLKSFPIALNLHDTDDLPAYMSQECRIRGEVYAIRPRQFITLDTHRQNGVQFQRIEVNINIGYRNVLRHKITDSQGKEYSELSLTKEHMCTQPCWMYVGREEYWRDQLESGFFDFQPIDIIEEDRVWLTRYYQYSRVR